MFESNTNTWQWLLFPRGISWIYSCRVNVKALPGFFKPQFHKGQNLYVFHILNLTNYDFFNFIIFLKFVINIKSEFYVKKSYEKHIKKYV